MAPLPPSGSVTETANRFGGVGFWVSSPKTTDGKFVAGTTTLQPGAQFQVSYRVVFATADDVLEPFGWVENNPPSYNKVALPATGLHREALNGAPFTVVRGNAAINDNVWTASITVNVDESNTSPLVVTGADSPYTQLLFSNFPLYYDYSETIQSFQIMVTVLNATVDVKPDSGAVTTVSFNGKTAVATLNLVDPAASANQP